MEQWKFAKNTFEGDSTRLIALFCTGGMYLLKTIPWGSDLYPETAEIWKYEVYFIDKFFQDS